MSNLAVCAVLAGAAVALVAAASPVALSQVQPGLWEISGAPGTSAPLHQCIADLATLARFEHRASNCTAKVSKAAGAIEAIDYSCGRGEFGHSEIEVITPRSLRISTQGISRGLPFNYVLQARRLDDCTNGPQTTRH
jgi:hypothetical protein